MTTAAARVPLDCHPDVQAALAAGAPVVALESTLVAHGMRWPHNLDTARRLVAEVRRHGAVPATIAVLGGRLKAGLSGDELQALARRGPSIPKASRRDLAALVARGGDGAKSILDLGLTLDVLETHGVPVVGCGTDTLPAFYVRDSGHRLEQRVDSADEAARLLHAQWSLGLKAGVVLANPIPAAHEMPRARIDAAIAQALAEAAAQGIRGKASTPFLLARVAALTGGDSLQANIALVLNNAAFAAQVAVAHAALAQPHGGCG